MPDITNYAYIWYNEAKPLLDIGLFHNIYVLKCN